MYAVGKWRDDPAALSAVGVEYPTALEYDAAFRLARELKPPFFALSNDIISTGIILRQIKRMLAIDKPLVANLHKINVYGEIPNRTSSALSHLGTITACLPTTFTGGELVVWHQGHEHVFDWFNAVNNNAVAWAFLYSDREHEVLPVKSGYRVTLAYDVFVDDSQLPASVKNSKAIEPITPTLKRVFLNPLFAPTGRRLGFGLRYAYPSDGDLHFGHNKTPVVHKGVDVRLVAAFHELGVDYRLKAVYRVDYDYRDEDDPLDSSDIAHVITDGTTL
ncbi:hypothetical protein Q5752_000938 [Cryptotrichosporon argae]